MWRQCAGIYAPNPKTCPRKTRTSTTDPRVGEILSSHLPPPVNMKMPSPKGWRKPPTKGPERMRGEGLVWERSPAISTLLNHWKNSPPSDDEIDTFSLAGKNHRLALSRIKALNF